MPDRPNVLVVLCDQLRRQALSCAGDPNVETPNIDRLAREGVRFENACSTYPICVPARFTLVTGEHAHSRHAHHGWRMSPAESTFGEAFADAGYRTAWIGKWHLADVPGHQPVPAELRRGFEHWRGFEVANEPFDTQYFADDDPEPRDLEAYQTDGLTDLAIEFVEERADGADPFCTVLSVEPPHPPFSAPEEYLDRVADRELELRPNVPYGDPDALPDRHVPPDRIEPYEAWGDREHAGEGLYERHNYHGDVVLDEMRGYYAMVENLDDNVGRLLDALEGAGVREDTAVVFVSDHGELLGSHGLMMKQHPHEESIGVPFVVSYPGEIDSGDVLSTPTCTEDWYPTLLGLAGIDAGETPGTDLGPLMRGDREDLDRPGVLLEFVREIRPEMAYAEETWRGFRTERYKYTVKGDSAAGAEPWQLFDLRADPYEEANLLAGGVGADADLAAELHGHLREALAESGDDYALAPAFGHAGLNAPTG
jgi:arylsulfatase A-like enzyme